MRILNLAVLLIVVLLFSPSIADAGPFGIFGNRNVSCGTAAVTACAPAPQATACAPVAASRTVTITRTRVKVFQGNFFVRLRGSRGC